ncbi:MAG: molybdate ABC transporter substrate-binding protein, partial [Bdellovibrionales bacterium]|nr:molybdate ABC transporter substrate-binding protein [Bdellovibrionales bacterium]
MRFWRLLTTSLFLLPLLLMQSVGHSRQSPILVSAAISLRRPLMEIYQLYKQQSKERHIQFNFASSGALKMQIEHGGAVDIFAPASPQYLDLLEKKGLIHLKGKRPLAANRLLLISTLVGDRGKKIASMFKGRSVQEILLDKRVKRIVVGDPRTVPVGQYAHQVFKRLKLWPQLQDKIVFANNARQVVEYLRRNEVDLGLVYATDW